MRSEPRPSAVVAPDPSGHGPIRLDFAADAMAVRTALEVVLDQLAAQDVAPDDRAMAEIVLAEVLNNVVEHAYGREGGWIELAAEVAGTDLCFTVFDWGRPMPGDALPSGDLPPPAAGELPEGGFGWHLIRALTAGLDHGREGGRNWLRFVLTTEQKTPLG